ncbi:hypothetical protein [Nonomuraea sp. NPDC001699]
MWRLRDDSPDPAAPRVLIRVQGTAADARFTFAAVGLESAMVGAFLTIAGGEAVMRPFRDTLGTLLVLDVRPYHERLVAEGAEIAGRADRSRFQRPAPRRDAVEYVRHRPTQN